MHFNETHTLALAALTSDIPIPFFRAISVFKGYACVLEYLGLFLRALRQCNEAGAIGFKENVTMNEGFEFQILFVQLGVRGLEPTSSDY